MKLHVLYIALIVCLVSSQSVFSQNLHTNSNHALKLYNDGKTAYDYLNMEKAEALFNEAVKTDPRFYEAYMMLGELYSKLKKYQLSASNYSFAIQIDSNAFRPVFFFLANSELMMGDYTNAMNHYRIYLRNKGTTEKNRLIAQKNLRNCEFAIEALKHPVVFEPVNAGSSVNTVDDEYWPSITADGQTLMFTRQVFFMNFPTTGKPMMQEDFYESFLKDNQWSTAVNAGAPLNTEQNEGAQTLSSNGNYMYFTACSRPGGMGSCDIYFSSFRNGSWSIPYNLGGPVNTGSWESTPSISADGKMLLFSSSRPGGKGGKDLWYSMLDNSGKWGVPVNMGDTINTEGDEMSPFIHFDGKTLYFSSDGRPGMGGFDIYMTRMNSDSTWSEPRNIGYPINTYNDEMGLVIESNGKRAYFSTIRDAKFGKDIYYFDLQESIRPDPVSYLKGNVTDKQTGKLLKADFELINLTTNRISIKSSTDEQGNFLVCLPSGYNYGINILKPGYLFYSDNFMLESQHTVAEPFIKKITLSPLKVGEKILLANVFYEVDSWELKKESMSELDNLADLLSGNKNLIVEIGGYTDSTGTDEYNQVLSEKRAGSVVSYLVSKGIQAIRLKPKGYGNSSPVGDNVTEEGRKLNRRTEAKIIGQ